MGSAYIGRALGRRDFGKGRKHGESLERCIIGLNKQYGFYEKKISNSNLNPMSPRYLCDRLLICVSFLEHCCFSRNWSARTEI